MRERMIKSVIMMMLMCVIGLTTSCSKDDDEQDTFSPLFSQTDYFIDMLDTVYEHYDAFGAHAKDSSDGKYTVTPIGRLIIVKKKTQAGDITYTDIKEALALHYKNNSKVDDVFLNNGGTVTIDCRK